MRLSGLLRALSVVVVGLLPLWAGAADTYQYDELGNLKVLTTGTGTHAYTYDEVNRLDQESGPAGARDYAYDRNGNRTTDGTGTTATYTAGSDRLATLNGTTVSLDAAGNLTNDGTNTYTWDAVGRLKTVSRGNKLLATYFYDHKNRRSRKETTSRAPQGALTVIYHYDQEDRLIGESLADGTPLKTYVWHDEGLAAILDHATTPPALLSLETDHLGTPRAARTADGKVVWRWDSDGYGTTPPNEDPDGNGIKTTINLRFPGQYYDAESGLHYNWNRYYAPKLGRYISSDPIGLDGGSNSYTYVSANPLIATDPFGLLEHFNLTLNKQTTTQLKCDCGDNYDVFSGSGDAANDPDQVANTDIGPIPQGEYYIVSRQSGGMLGGLRDAARRLGGNDPSKWFALVPKGGNGDCRVVNGVVRCNFRMHPGGRSKGCITFKSENAFYQLREKLLKTEPGMIPGTNTIYFGTVTVQ